MSNQVINYIDSEFELLCRLGGHIVYHEFQGAVQVLYTLDLIDKKTMIFLVESSTEIYYE